jgi:hypothetical protein
MNSLLLSGLLLAQFPPCTPQYQTQACIDRLRLSVPGVRDIRIIAPGRFTYTVPGTRGKRVEKTHSCWNEGAL